MQGGERGRLMRAGQIGAGDDLAAHAGLQGAPHDRVPICIETVMGEVRSNVNQVQRQDSKPRCDIFDGHCRRELQMLIKNILLTVMLLFAVRVMAQEGGDTQAQIDYAYQTEDANRLANLIQNLTNRVKDNSADIPLRYH